MVNSVPNNGISNPIRTSIFYVNDLHGQSMKMEKIYNASKSFDQYTPSAKVDKLKLSSGDSLLGTTKKPNTFSAKFLDLIGVTATAVGNHECDMDSATLTEITADKKFKMLGLNVKINPESALSKRIEKSYIEEKADGTKYGIIGLMPPDLFTRCANRDDYAKKFQIQDFNETIKEVQTEVDRLQKEGVNKIIVVSHAGNTNEKRLAQETSGIDVILGGHTHELIKDVKEGENLLYGKDGNPVVITQAGKDADNFGVLNLEFDNDGVITKVQNNVNTTKNFRRNAVMKYLSELILGKPEVVGEIKSSVPEPENRLACENPHANLVADAMKDYTGADIAWLGAANLRSTFEKGEITTRDVSSVLPFKNGMVIVPLSEKKIVEAFKYSAKSLVNPGTKPGLLQVSGLNYTVNKSGESLSMDYVDKNGQKQAINVQNPSENKTFRVAMDTYLAKGGDGFTSLNTMDIAEKKYEEDKDKMTEAYIKKMNGEVEVKADGRISVVD